MRISIIGYGAFGKLWADILAPDFEVVVTGGTNHEERAKINGHKSVSRDEALLSDVIFYSVPISLFESVIEEDVYLIEKIGNHPLIIDLLSVKVHPEKIFQKYLPKNIPTLLMHPMFGPESVGKNGGLHGLNLVLCGGTATSEVYNFWKGYFLQKLLVLHEMSTDEHDQYAAKTQAVTHYTAQLLNRYGVEHSPIDTASARDLIQVVHSLRSDGGRLFRDMMTYNPYVRELLESLHLLSDEIYREYTK